MSEVIFYQLGSKILERASDVPEKAKQVVYYSLAIGHHVGVIDTFHPMLACEDSLFDRLVAKLPAGEARRKFDGLKRFGEIIVDRTHTRLLGGALNSIRDALDSEERQWASRFIVALAAIEAEPAIYLMGRVKP
ncbi:hydrogenase-4 component J [Rhodoblastus acidophilus]|uniref:formate hydrogenlyase maturation HycH family protein n=1 Tax=Rhodoblastus acidophilus TaxID=1074 RepID=UPI002223F350|nr:formate hydrogenlyase maturation HycH family protein [Rhodoblastus acidophilus]MCW2285404.1 hydrogenase-4 component J [Rhodoblastus acidophilus]MCW2334347.1 hydrogenase-4 component J [Rhodoblastus acidophilus]